MQIESDPGLSPSRAKIKIFTRDGRVLEKLMDTLDLGKDRGKMRQDLMRKFRELSAPLLGQEKTEKLIPAIMQLEEIPDLSTAVRLL